MSSDAHDSSFYEAWRQAFARERLHTLYYLGLTANPVFLISDLLFYRDHISTLLTIRAILEMGLLLVFFTLIR